MPQALYRKYRSRSLGEIVGQSHVTDVLAGAFQKGNISHAYLLTGPRGIGKTSVARIIAHEINKLPYSDETNLDIIEIDAASNRRIDDIRELREKVHIAPVGAAYKVYIIDEVHMLTGESFNALLKTLEEPPAYVVFILATTELHKVPATIISRTQRFHFRPVAETVVAEHLGYIAKKENIKIDQDALRLIAKHGGGSFRDSISLLDQLSHSEKNISVDDVEAALGLLPESQIANLIDAVVKRKLTDVLAIIKRAGDEGASHVTLADQLAAALTNTAQTKPELYPLINQLLDVRRSHSPEIKLLALLANYARPVSSQSLSVDQEPVIKRHVAVLKKEVKAAKAEALKESGVPAPIKPSPPRSSVDGFDWDMVIQTVKAYDAPLYSVLSRATHDFDGSTLTLAFRYTIHRKKLENPKYRSTLIKMITDVCGSCPEIVISDASAAALSSEASAVADIMGGGDSVHASI